MYDKPQLQSSDKELPYNRTCECGDIEKFSVKKDQQIDTLLNLEFYSIPVIKKPRVEQALQEIKVMLKKCFSNNPLALWKEDHPHCRIEQKDQNELDRLKIKVPIRLTPIKATPEDMIEFKTQIKEL